MGEEGERQRNKYEQRLTQQLTEEERTAGALYIVKQKKEEVADTDDKKICQFIIDELLKEYPPHAQPESNPGMYTAAKDLLEGLEKENFNWTGKKSAALKHVVEKFKKITEKIKEREEKERRARDERGLDPLSGET